MVQRLGDIGISNLRVMEAMLSTPRHLFIEEAFAHRAYEDVALPIAFNRLPWLPTRLMERPLSVANLKPVLERGAPESPQSQMTRMLARVKPATERTLKYLADTLVTDVELVNQKLKIQITCNDTVASHENIFLRRLCVTNLISTPRDVKIFLHHDFRIYESNFGDTAMFDPESQGIVHYKARCYYYHHQEQQYLDQQNDSCNRAGRPVFHQ